MNIDSIITIIGTVLGSSAVTMLIQYFIGKRKSKVDADTVTIDNILKWATSLMAQINELEKKIDTRDLAIQALYKRLEGEDHGIK